jgi:hypothetical protein
MCLFLRYFRLFWRFVDADVIFHRRLVCTYHAVLRFVVLFLVAEFRVLVVKFLFWGAVFFFVYFPFLVVEFFLVILCLWSGGG